MNCEQIYEADHEISYFTLEIGHILEFIKKMQPPHVLTVMYVKFEFKKLETKVNEM